MSAKRDFTDRFLKAIKPAAPGKRVVYMDGVVPQFGIRVSDCRFPSRFDPGFPLRTDPG
jgi:hypothetical protein